MVDDDMRDIPQAALDHYNRRYNNTTYRAFRAVCAAILPDCRLPTGDGSLDLMNLLIDASLECSGAAFYEGACARLRNALEPYPQLQALASAHLANFGCLPEAFKSS